MNTILFDASSTSPISDIVAVAPGDCLLINAWGLAPGQTAQVFRVLIALGSIPAQQAGSCVPPPAVQGATIQTEVPYAPCNAIVEVGQTPIENLTSILLQQPGFYRLHLTPAALGTAIVEAVVLTGADACAAAAAQCCCEPQAFWDGSSTNPCLVITPGGPLGHSPVFSLDACCLLESFPPNAAPTSVDELIVLSGGTCFRSTIGQVFANALFCEALVAFPILGPAAGDRIAVVDAGDNCKTVDAETLVEFFETPWTGISLNPNLTIAPGGVNGHGPTFDYDLCADLNDLPVCGCEPVTGDLIPIIQAGNCTLATFPEVDFCVQVGALVVGTPIAGDTVPVREAGGTCKQVPIEDFPLFPVLAPDGTCAAPSYSFSTDPASGMLYEAGVPAVTIGFNNCSAFARVGDEIRLEATNGDFIEVGASINITSPLSDVTITALVGDASLRAPSGEASIRGAGLARAVFDGDIDIVSPSGGVSILGNPAGGASVSVSSAGQFQVQTNSIVRLQIQNAGDWDIGGTPGTLGQVITSQGVGTPPVWANTVPAFPILAPNGTCAAPSYSFTSSPDSGMFYTGTAVRISDDNCGDFIEVGASITIQGGPGAPGSTITILGGDGAAAADDAGGVNLGGGNSVTGNGGTVSIFGGVRSAGNTGAQIVLGGAVNNNDGGDLVLQAGSQTGGAVRGDITAFGGSFLIQTVNVGAPVDRLKITDVGAWEIAGSPGVLGQAITSGGPGAPPTWTTPTSLNLYDESSAGFVAPSAGGTLTFCVGSGASSAGTSTFALGTGANASSLGAIAVGPGTLANAAAASAFGNNAQATASEATALGEDTIASAIGTLAVGPNSQATAVGAVAVGRSITNAVAGSAHFGSLDTNKLVYSVTGVLSLIGTGAMFHLPNYTVATLPTAANSGGFIYVTDESGGAVPAFSDTVNWRRVTDRAIVT